VLNIRLRPGRKKDLLWHPIKPPKAWLRQWRKRYVSMAQWYLNRLTRSPR